MTKRINVVAVAFVLGLSVYDSLADSRSERFEVVATDSIEIFGEFYTPRNTRKLGQLVQLVHELGQDSSQLKPLAEDLAQNNFTMSLLDLRGHGQSKTDTVTWDEEAQQKLIGVYAIRDLEASYLKLKKRPDVNGTREHLVCYKTGCYVALRYGLKGGGATSIVMIYPEAYGDYSFEADLVDSEGIPILIVVERKKSKEWQTLIDRVEARFDYPNDSSIELKKKQNALDNRKNYLTDWLQDRFD